MYQQDLKKETFFLQLSVSAVTLTLSAINFVDFLNVRVVNDHDIFINGKNVYTGSLCNTLSSMNECMGMAKKTTTNEQNNKKQKSNSLKTKMPCSALA